MRLIKIELCYEKSAGEPRVCTDNHGLALNPTSYRSRGRSRLACSQKKINQSKVRTKPHAGKGEATFQHHHTGQQRLHHEVMQTWGGGNESRQH